MKVTVCFDNVRVVVPCGDGTLLVRDLMHEATLRYKKATGKSDSALTITSLSSLTGGGLLDPDDRLCDVADDREQIVAHFIYSDVIHAGGDGASSVGTNSPDFFHGGDGHHHHHHHHHQHHPQSSNIKRESTKRLSMHVLSTREPYLTTYSAQSLPRESRRKEPLGQDAKSFYELSNFPLKSNDEGEIREIVIKNEAGPLGLHVVPCYDLSGNDQGLRVEGIEPNGRIAKDGQIELHDNIIKINGHNLLRMPFSKVQEIFRTCMSEPCLNISVLKHKKKNIEKSVQKSPGNTSKDKIETEENVKKLQGTNYNILQTANTRKIGKMIEIELTKGGNGLGFSVTTRDNPAGGHCPIYIKNILPKGAAVEDGRLKPGDRLLEVNKKEMTGKSQDEVVALLRSILPGGKVKLLVSRQEEVSANTSDSQIVVPVSDSVNTSRNSQSSHRSPIKKSDEEKLDSYSMDKFNFKTIQISDEVVLSPKKNRMILTLDIPVHDSEKAGLGVSVKGKTSSNDDNTNVDLGIFIKSVLHGGAASRDGRLRTNDQLLNVNGVSLLGLSNSDAMETLRRAMLNTNSSVTGVISLTIARRVSSYDTCEKHFVDNVPSHGKLESVNTVYISDSSKRNEGKVKDIKNNVNSPSDSLDNGSLLSSASASPWNPVIDRLTEQYNKNSLRNESYCIATNKIWMEPSSNINVNVKKLTLPQNGDRLDSVLLEDSNHDSHGNEIKRNSEDKDSQYSGDPTYDSQLSLEEFNSPTNKFSRDALGRQSMSEKRHAVLDAKNTDTYKRNKKLREGRENKSAEHNSHSEDVGDEGKRGYNVEKFEKLGDKVGESSSFDSNRKHYDKKYVEQPQPEYLYTIPGCNNKHSSPRKHWLVDDVHSNNIPNANNFNEVREGFSNTRGDVKQASLNSALDDRYKRSRKKGGIRSMLRLGKNRKSLNFGDNLENRHETNNYCSGTINYISLVLQTAQKSVSLQQIRFRSKINIQRPKPFHHERGKVMEFLTPFYANPDKGKKLWEVCHKGKKKEEQKFIANPYQTIIAREILNWFNNSKMVGFFHLNSIKAENEFNFKVNLKMYNMYSKVYGRRLMKIAVTDTVYEPVLKLFSSPVMLVFSPEANVNALVKAAKKTPEVILMAGILEGKLLNRTKFLEYGNMDLTSAQVGLVSVLQSAGGNNLNRQLTHHQSTLVTRLEQISTSKSTCDNND